MKPDAVGSFALVLHSHIPYVLAHGHTPHGTNWLFEVAAETYIPLLDVFQRLVAEGISPCVTLGLTPILVEQLADPTFPVEFDAYLQQQLQAARNDQVQFARDGDMHLLGMAHYWENFYSGVRDRYVDVYGQDIVGAFRQLQDDGHIEILTSAATHSYLPLLLTDESVQAQIKQGVQTYRKHFGCAPRGFWLPECAYRPGYAWNPPDAKYRAEVPVFRKGIEAFLAASGIEYFCVDAHLLTGGEAIGVYADRFAELQDLWTQFSKTYAGETADRNPYTTYLVSDEQAGGRVAVFSRDPLTGTQVWSGESGYPGDPYYLEFHKKHYPGSLRYWRVSESQNDLGSKALYEPRAALHRARTHGAHFTDLVRATLTTHQSQENTPGIVTAMYDTELFGHWWFEGPEFLYHALKCLHDDPQIHLTTCADYLHAHPPTDVIALPEGSWGKGGYHWIWLNEWTAWTWDKIYEAEREMVTLAREYANVPHVAVILKQVCRELLLLESSDWQFSISTYTSRDYAEQRVHYHFTKFKQLAALTRRAGANDPLLTPADWKLLSDSADRDRCFADVEPEWWK